MSDQSSPRQASRAFPFERYVISVDGQRKMGYADRAVADAVAERLRADYPVLTVLVRDETDALIRERA